MGVVQKLSSSKVAGYDNTPFRLVKDGADIIADPLAKLFNNSIGSSAYPSPWKYGKVNLFSRRDMKIVV